MVMTIVFLGCGGSANVRSDSVTQRGMRADTALINERRRARAKAAQVTAAQEKHYNLARRLSNSEMEYQEKEAGKRGIHIVNLY
jgi:hypothetical protein